jgi:hypothetical protein
MKTKLLALVATLGMVASASAVKINNNLSINGFIDGSYQSTNDERTPANDDQSLGLDEVELNFVLNVGNVSGLVAIDTDAAEDEDADDARDTLFNIEQAHLPTTSAILLVQLLVDMVLLLVLSAKILPVFTPSAVLMATMHSILVMSTLMLSKV